MTGHQLETWARATFDQLEELCVAIKVSRSALYKMFKRPELDGPLTLALAQVGCPVAIEEARRSHYRRVSGRS